MQKLEVCQISPRLKLLLQKENITITSVAKSLGMSQTMLSKMLDNPNQIYPWVTLSKILWIAGYKIEGLRLSKREY